jgi:hypothetical protein
MSEEWGPWIRHDGKGCPCAGSYVESEQRDGLIEQHIAEGVNPELIASAWDWSSHLYRDLDIIAYRIRKPRGLTILEELLVNLPERVDA